MECPSLSAALAFLFPPRYSEKIQPVQQPAAFQFIGLAQVQIKLPLAGFRMQAQTLLLTRKVLCQRHHRRVIRDLSEAIADTEHLETQLER